MANNKITTKNVNNSINELDDEIITLAVQINDSTKQARDLEDAFDIATDTTLDLAKAETDLIKSINTKSNSIDQSININDGLAYSQKETLELERQYQLALERKTELAKKINEQREIIRYSDNIDKIPLDNSEPIDNDIISQEPNNELDKDTLDDYLKSRNLSDLKKFKKELDDLKKKQQEESGVFKKVLSDTFLGSLQMTSDATKMVMSQSSNMLENAMGLSEIPLYNEAKQLTKFALNKTTSGISNVTGLAKDKLIERKFNKEKEKASKEFYSKTSETGETIVNNEQIEKNQKEEKKERDNNKTERDNNEKRHKGIMGGLGDIAKAILFSSLSKLGIGLLTSIASGVIALGSGIGGVITAVVGLGATILAGFKSALAGVVSKMFPGKFPDLEKDAKTKPNNTKTTDGKNNKPTNKPTTGGGVNTANKPTTTGGTGVGDVKSANKPIDVNTGKNVGKSVGNTGKIVGATETVGGGVIKKVGKKTMVSGAMKVLALGTGVGTALLAAEAAYHILDYATDGKFGDSVSSLVDAMEPKKAFSEISAIQSGVLSPEQRASMTKEEADAIDKKRADDRKKMETDARMADFRSITNNKSNTNHIYMSGFHGLNSNSNKYVPPYGITNG